MKTSIFVRYTENPPNTYPSFWIVGVKPFGLNETAIETKIHFTAQQAAEDYYLRSADIQ